MIVFPNCKINLGLQVLRKRTDGYHDLQTIFYPVGLEDSLEIIADPAASDDLIFTSSGRAINGAEDSNLCVKAFRLLKSRFESIPNCRIHLHKRIPMGAGLGGGSSDAAFTLMLLNDRFRLGLRPGELTELALQLGSDCPFFIVNTPSLAAGRGELLTPIEFDLSAYKIVLVCPSIHIATAWAFKAIHPSEKGLDLVDIINLPVSEWKHQLVNDFQEPVFAQHPQLADMHQTLYDQGAVYAAMSGSGSVIFGLFETVPASLPTAFSAAEVYIL